MIFSKGMYDKEFKFTDEEGKEQTILIKPLGGKSLGKLFKLAYAFDIKKDTITEDIDTSEIFNKLVEKELVNDIYDLVEETVFKSYPDQDKDVLKEFAVKNMFVLLPFVFEVNFGKNVK